MDGNQLISLQEKLINWVKKKNNYKKNKNKVLGLKPKIYLIVFAILFFYTFIVNKKDTQSNQNTKTKVSEQKQDNLNLENSNQQNSNSQNNESEEETNKKTEVTMETSFSPCYVRDYYEVNGELYIEVDYIIVETHDKDGNLMLDDAGLVKVNIINNNPKIRTFKVKEGLKVGCVEVEDKDELGMDFNIDIKEYIIENKLTQKPDNFYNIIYLDVVNGTVVKFEYSTAN